MPDLHRIHPFFTTIRRMLASGLGVEDIAVHLGCDIASVRLEVSYLRTTGQLINLLGKGNQP